MFAYKPMLRQHAGWAYAASAVDQGLHVLTVFIVFGLAFWRKEMK